MSRKQIDFNKVVNIAEDGEITVLEYVFSHDESFKGAVGSRFYPVSKSEYEEKIDPEYVIDYLIDSGLELPDEFKRSGFKGMVDQMTASEIENLMFDTSYSELWNYLRKTTGLDKEKAYIFECVGGGRCFSADFDGNVNPHLSEIIREFEGK